MHSVTQSDAIEMSEHMATIGYHWLPLATPWDCAREHVKKVNRSRTSNMINMLKILAGLHYIHLPAGKERLAGKGRPIKFSSPLKVHLGLYITL